MRGDFSRRDDEQKKKYSAVLHQQGRVLLDSDWNDQVALQEYWKDILSRDVIGQDVVAVPAAQKDSFKISEATRDASKNIKLKIGSGRVWVNGMLLQNDLGNLLRDVKQFDDYAASDREAILVRAWQQEVSAFQDEELLLEKALGGSDTTERIENVYEIYKIPAEEMTCEEIRQKVSQLYVDDPAKKLKLNVRFQPTTEADLDGNDCPAVQMGGYRGLEHSLYRIEMDNVNTGKIFKWSHVNGGLVGCGYFQEKEGFNYLIPTKNTEALFHSGFERFSDCYIETYEKHPQTHMWEVKYGGMVKVIDRSLKIISDRKGSRPASVASGAVPTEIFFRLWSGVKDLRDFQTGWRELRDGIQLHFPNGDAGQFLVGDYWTFEARVNAPASVPNGFTAGATIPHGPVYQNACLGVVDWTEADVEPHDCRKIFDPLVDIDNGCCIEVSPEEDLATAVEQIKDAGGGCICLMPGIHNVRRLLDFSDTKGVVFKGVGINCILKLDDDYKEDFVFLLNNSTETSFYGFTMALEEKRLKSVWEAPSAFKVSIRDTQIYCPYDSKLVTEEIYATPFRGGTINGLELRSNIWLSWKSIKVTFLTDAVLERNWFLFGDNAIFAVAALSVQLQNNRLMVISADSGNVSFLRAFNFHRNDPVRLSGLILSIFHTMSYWLSGASVDKLQTYVMSNALQFVAAVQVDLNRNLISAGRGLQTLFSMDCVISENKFVSTVYATQTLLWAQGVRIKDNTVDSPNNKGVTVGFHFAAKALNIRVADNVVNDSREGVVFDVAGPAGLLKQAKITARRYGMFEDAKGGEDLEKRIVRESRQEVKEALEFLSRQSKGVNLNDDMKAFDVGSMIGDSFDAIFDSEKLAKLPPAMMVVEDINIESNRLKSSWTGIEIAGARSVGSYSIVNNLISGCENVAIHLPGESAELTENSRDHRKQVSHNKILSKGVAIWSWQNEIRIESNDIRIYPSNWNAMNWFKSIFELTELWPFLSAILEDESDEDLEDPKVIEKMAQSLRKVAEKENFESMFGKDSPWSENFDYLKNAGKDKLTEEAKALLAIKIVQMMIAAIRGFAVGVWGISSSVRLNKIDVEATTIPGGLITGSLSGEVAENEILAERMGVMLAEDPRALNMAMEKKVEKILYTPTQIAGNRISARAAVQDDKEQSSFALLIPKILRGDVSITGNHFVGDIHIGRQDLDITTERTTLTSMDMDRINKSVKATANTKAATFKRFQKVTKKAKKPKEDKGARLPHPKILFSQNQTISGAVSILPFGFKMTVNRETKKEDIVLVESKDNQQPMVTFTSNQLDSGDKTSFIFGYQVILSGNQSLIDANHASERYKLVGMAYNRTNLYVGGNMPEAQALQHE